MAPETASGPFAFTSAIFCPATKDSIADMDSIHGVVDWAFSFMLALYISEFTDLDMSALPSAYPSAKAASELGTGTRPADEASANWNSSMLEATNTSPCTRETASANALSP